MHTWIFTRYFCYLYFPHLVANDIIPKGCYHLTGTFTTFLKFLIIVCVSMVLCGPHHGVQYCSFFLPTWQGHVLCILSLIKSVTEKNIFFFLYNFVQFCTVRPHTWHFTYMILIFTMLWGNYKDMLIWQIKRMKIRDCYNIPKATEALIFY